MASLGPHFDTIVIGGGPGGATAASLIAVQGHKVLLLERDAFPRHQIGESLLPATVHGICGLLGLKDEIAQAGFPRKIGGTFRWGKSEEPWTFKFAANSDAPGGFAYQVERSKFDEILLNNARRKGVDVRQRHEVTEIIFDGDRAVGVKFLDQDKQVQTAHARFILDAGGTGASRYNPHVGKRIYSKLFQNIAVYGYFENGKRLPAPNQGNILCCAFDEGWFWYIPLNDKLTSVGAVVSRDVAGNILQSGHEQTLNHFLSRCPFVQEYLTNATRVMQGPYGKVRIRSDYSYCNTSFQRSGIALIGDAACFVDPVFSSGVHLATYSALLAARSVNSSLRDDGDNEAAYLDEFERRYRREYGNFYQFCSAFYDMEQITDSYFWAARKILNTDEKSNEAFVRLVAGVAAQDDPVFSAGDFFQARIGFGVWFADTISQSNSEKRSPMRNDVPAFDRNRFDPDHFMRGFTQEIAGIQLQALYGKGRPKESPLFENGLVASQDGFHWIAAQ